MELDRAKEHAQPEQSKSPQCCDHPTKETEPEQPKNERIVGAKEKKLSTEEKSFPPFLPN